MGFDNPAGPTVMKVGGSLFDWPDLRTRLTQWLAALNTRQTILVPGGGRAADGVRDLDRRHKLGEEASHWLALRALTSNALFLAELLKESRPVVAGHIDDLNACLATGTLAILDAYTFAREDEARAGCLPHCWEATSDSVAARLAVVIDARWLVLLKSIAIPDRLDWSEAAKCGYVDAIFPSIVANAGQRQPLEVRAINLRTWQPSRAT